MINLNSLLFLLGAIWIGLASALLFSYNEYKPYSEPIMIVLTVSTAIISFYDFIRKK
ncbi:MAG TPA: hypothetical protein PKN56_17280 [Leptospiraceae bacterium]|nr:hypothetical protein [Leptospiraceae bacterium]